MTKSDLQSLLKRFGIRSEELADKVYAKLEEEKAELDTETRRKVRQFWIGVSVVTFAVGVFVGHLFW
ncbi:hypothetical protein [Parasutterella secunda]|uniref:hypothetical protein n=1 Tax=Parasutterella secunda TaxID=626947 RepID=UPI0025A3DEDF|nr:hypothetical protein [Parasutterella secunda]MDM8227774.1 hypothetical protein [Parasutterella secunda]